jgi:hypothetical protein
VKRNTLRAPTAAMPSIRRFPLLGARAIPVTLALSRTVKLPTDHVLITLGARAIAVRRMAELYSCCYRISETRRRRRPVACSAFEADQPVATGSAPEPSPM